MAGVKGRSGGARPGAGNKKIRVAGRITYRPEPDLQEWLNSQPEKKNRIINRAVRMLKDSSS